MRMPATMACQLSYAIAHCVVRTDACLMGPASILRYGCLQHQHVLHLGVRWLTPVCPCTVVLL